MGFWERVGRRGKCLVEDCSSEQLALAVRLDGLGDERALSQLFATGGLDSFGEKDRVAGECLLLLSRCIFLCFPTDIPYCFKISVLASNGLDNWRTLGEVLLLKSQQKITCGRFQPGTGKGTH